MSVWITQDLVIDKVDKLVDKMQLIHDLHLPLWGGRSCGEQIAWLSKNFTQESLRDMMIRGIKALDKISSDDPEWDTLADQLDPIWYALDEEMRP